MTEPVALKPGNLVPKTAAPLRTLTAVMAVMCYLAVLALGAMVLIDQAVDSWAKGLASEVTVQLRQTSKNDIESDIKASVALLEKTNGIIKVESLPRAAGEKLLEPWIGASGLDKLPIPRLIRVVIAENNPPDFTKLATALREAVPTAQLDTHRRWEAELKRMAGTLTLLSSLVLGLISLSAVAMVVFASRAVLEANRDVVEVLQLAGAEDRFIAREIDWRFFSTGFWAGMLGLGFGIFTFAALGFIGASESNGVAAAARSLFYVPTQGGMNVRILVLFLVPASATAIALLTSRLALMRLLRGVA